MTYKYGVVLLTNDTDLIAKLDIEADRNKQVIIKNPDNEDFEEIMNELT